MTPRRVLPVTAGSRSDRRQDGTRASLVSAARPVIPEVAGAPLSFDRHGTTLGWLAVWAAVGVGIWAAVGKVVWGG